MSCDVGEATESLENELCYDYNYELCSFSKLLVASPTSHLILRYLRRLTYVTAHSSTIPLLHLRHSSFSNPSFASPTSQDFHLRHLASRPSSLPWLVIAVPQVQDAYNVLWFISHYLITVNAALNPVIYGLTNETFRRAFRTTRLAKLFFGASATVSLPRMPRKPVVRQESKHLGLQNPDLNHWFIIPKQKKTVTTDCYI